MSKLSHLLVLNKKFWRILCKDSFGFRFALADAWNNPEVHLFTGSCRLLRRLFDLQLRARLDTNGKKKKKKKNRSRIYDLGVVPTRGNNTFANSCQRVACGGGYIWSCFARKRCQAGLFWCITSKINYCARFSKVVQAAIIIFLNYNIWILLTYFNTLKSPGFQYLQ